MFGSLSSLGALEWISILSWISADKNNDNIQRIIIMIMWRIKKDRKNHKFHGMKYTTNCMHLKLQIEMTWRINWFDDHRKARLDKLKPETQEQRHIKIPFHFIRSAREIRKKNIIISTTLETSHRCRALL